MNGTYFRALNSPLCHFAVTCLEINNSEARSLPLPAICERTPRFYLRYINNHFAFTLPFYLADSRGISFSKQAREIAIICIFESVYLREMLE